MTQRNIQDDFENGFEDDGVLDIYEGIDSDELSVDELTAKANEKLFAGIDKYLDE